MANIFGKFYELIDKSLDARIEGVGSVEDLEKAERKDGLIGRKGLIFDPYMDQSHSAGLFKPKVSFLSNTMLKQVSRRDAVVAAIIDVRCSQVSAACRKQNSRFDLGFKLMPKNTEVEVDKDEVRKLEEFILNTGSNESRSDEEKMTFDQWGYMVSRDFQVYGHAAIEKVLSGDKKLHSFLPLAAETIYFANKKVSKETISGIRNTYRQAINEDSVKLEDAEAGKYEFIQVIDNKVMEGFYPQEIIFARFNLETDIDLNGYSVGPLERAMSAVISHMQVENHQRQFFTHGIASKGLLVIQGDVAPNTLKTLQAQWNNQITGPVNAWRTPILAGIPGVQWVPLTASNRDMEYAAWQDYVLRVMFAAFGMDPEEAGFGYLSKGTEQRSMGESSNEWKITASRDRGLRPILTRIEAIINEQVIPAYDKAMSEKYHFCFVGLDSETELEETSRLQAEIALHTTLNEARKIAEKEPLPVGGDIILNPLLLQYLQMNMYKGQFMETYMGIKGAAERPDLQYIPDPSWFQWQAMQQQMMQQQAGAQGQGGGQPPQDGVEGGEEDEQALAEQQAQQEAARAGIEQYMAANPELFKTAKANIEKAEDLRKSQAVKKRLNIDHVEEQTEKLLKDFRRANAVLIKEIMEVVKEDTEGKDD